MAHSQSSVQSTSAMDYEQLLEEMEKLNIADLLLIHRRISMRWAQPLKIVDTKISKDLIVLRSR